MLFSTTAAALKAAAVAGAKEGSAYGSFARVYACFVLSVQRGAQVYRVQVSPWTVDISGTSALALL